MNRNMINALKSTRLYAPGSYSYYTKNQCYSLKIIQQNKKIIKRNKNMSQQMNVNKKFRRTVSDTDSAKNKVLTLSWHIFRLNLTHNQLHPNTSKCSLQNYSNESFIFVLQWQRKELRLRSWVQTSPLNIKVGLPTNCNKHGYIFLVKSWLCETKAVIDIVFGW